MGSENLTSATEFILVGLTSHRKTQILLFVVILIIYLLPVTGNLLIILLVRTDSQLQTPMYCFLTHLSGLEICFVTSTIPQMLTHLMAGNGTISFPCCVVQLFFATCLGSVECFLLGAMAYDCYMAICRRPLLYAIAMGKWRQLQLTMASWAAGFLLASINIGCTVHLPFCSHNRINHFICEVPALLELACGKTRVTDVVIFVVASLILMVSLSVILASYGFILYSVLQMKSAAGQRKAFSTCASHLVVVTLFYGTALFTDLSPKSGTAPDYDKQLAVFYIVVTPLLNPIIYTLRNKDVHGAVPKVLQRWGLKQ